MGKHRLSADLKQRVRARERARAEFYRQHPEALPVYLETIRGLEERRWDRTATRGRRAVNPFRPRVRE